MCLKNRRTDELQRLLSEDTGLASRVNDLDGDGFGLLHNIAYHNASLEAIDVILGHGGDINLRNGELKETAFTPVRCTCDDGFGGISCGGAGCADTRACDTALGKNGGFWGPFVDV